MFVKLLFQALCILKSSHSKTWHKTEEQVGIKWQNFRHIWSFKIQKEDKGQVYVNFQVMQILQGILKFWEIYIRLIPWHCPIHSLC